MYQNFDKSNFSIDWSNPACKRIENIYDSYLNSKDNNKIIPFFSLKEIEENKEFLKNMDSHIDERTFCELIDCNKDEISDKLKMLYSFLNQCKKSIEEYNIKFKKFEDCVRYLFNPYTGEYDNDLKFKHIDRFYSLYKDIDCRQLEKVLKRYNKIIDSYEDFHEEIRLKRAYCSQIEKLKTLSIDIHEFLELGKNVKKIDKQKKAIKINNRFKCIPKKFKNTFMEKYNIPEDLTSILNKAIYCFNGRIRNSLGA